MRLGILTGGEGCPRLNAVIRAAAVHTIRSHGGVMPGFEDGWRGLPQDRIRELDLNGLAGFLPRGGAMRGTSPLDPFREPRGSKGCARRSAITSSTVGGCVEKTERSRRPRASPERACR